MIAHPSPPTETNELPPSIFKSWRRLYSLVLGELVLLILLFYLFTKVFE